MTANEISASEFGQLFLKYRDRFISIALSYTRNSTAAEDIVAESFTNFWDNRDRIEIKTVPEAYILQSVKNRSLNYLRDNAARMRISQNTDNCGYKAMMAEIELLSTEDMGLVFRSDVRKIFMDSMETLPETTRNIFCASRFEDLTYQEIADRYNISQRKVKRDIQNVLSIMRRSLKDYLPFLPLVITMFK